MGRIWREIGAYDEHASLRQQDQFIFLDDLPDFLNAVADMFALGDTVTKDMIARMAIPVMEFTYGDKVHRSDVTKALFEAKHAIKKSTVRKHLGSQLDQKYKNLIRKIENDYENKWNNQLSSITIINTKQGVFGPTAMFGLDTANKTPNLESRKSWRSA